MAAEHLERMGARIERRRKELGMSRGEVARQMPGKTNENAIYRWEKGHHRANDDALDALAKVLKTSVAAFMLDDPEPGNGDLLTAIGHGANQDGQRLLVQLLKSQGEAAAMLRQLVERQEALEGAVAALAEVLVADRRPTAKRPKKAA